MRLASIISGGQRWRVSMSETEMNQKSSDFGRTLRQHCQTFRMNGAQLRILQKADEIGFRGCLQYLKGLRLESQARLVARRNLMYQAFEGKSPDKQICRLLVAADLSERYRTRTVAMGLFYATGKRDANLMRDRQRRCLANQ